MNIEIKQIISFLGNAVIKVYGDFDNVFVNNIIDSQRVNTMSLDWINSTKSNKQEIAEQTKAKTLLVDQGVIYSERIKADRKILIVVKDPKIALAKIGNHFFVKHPIHSIHPTAIVDPEAIIGRNVNVGPYSVIGKCTIGNNTYIDSHVRIQDDVVIGEWCVFESGCVIGEGGFAYQKDDDGNWFHFPQIGKLIIGNHVEIGANTCVDKGALSDTILEDYVKIDNLCQVSHNDKIGRNVIMTGHSGLAGSVTVEDDVWISPNSAVNNAITIGRNSLVGVCSAVNKDIPENEVWFGVPAKRLCKNKYSID